MDVTCGRLDHKAHIHYLLCSKEFWSLLKFLPQGEHLDQVEVSATDARTLGIDAPVRESGDVKGSGACKLIGPKGEVELTEGVIVAKRHLHILENEANELGIKNGDIIKVACGGEGRKLIFDDVVVRVNKDGATTMHIDTDESQAAGNPTVGEIFR